MQFTEVTLPDGVEEITGSRHTQILGDTTAKGRYWYRMDDIKLARPFIVIDKSNGSVRSDALASKQDVANWFNNIMPSYLDEPVATNVTTPSSDTDAPAPLTEVVLSPSDIAAFTAPPSVTDLAEYDETRKKIHDIGEQLATILGMERSTAKVPTFPADLVGKLVELQIRKADVEYLTGVFEENVDIDQIRSKVRSMVVTDSSQAEIMRECHELRLLLREYRLNFVKLVDTSKDVHHRRWQVHTGYKKIVVDLLKEEEAFLEYNEKFAKREKEAKLEAIREERKQVLLDLGCEKLPELDLATLKDNAWEAILNAEKAAAELREATKKQEEEQRILREQKMQRANDRINALSRIGLNFNGVEYAFGSTVRVPKYVVEDSDNDTFEVTVKDVTEKVSLEKVMQEQTQERVKRLNEIGIVWNGSLYSYAGHLETINITEADIIGLNGIFDMKLAEWQLAISRDKDAKESSDRRKERIASLVALGFVEKTDDNGTASNQTYFDQEGVDVVPYSTIMLGSAEWATRLAEISAAVTAMREAAAKVARENAEREASARALRLASDREQFVHLASNLEATANGFSETYSFQDDASKALFAQAEQKLRDLVVFVRAESERLSTSAV